MHAHKLACSAIMSILLALMLSCSRSSEIPLTTRDTAFPFTAADDVSRGSKILSDAVKMSPETDEHPPQVHSSEYEQPIPLPGGINTAGSEISCGFVRHGKDIRGCIGLLPSLSVGAGRTGKLRTSIPPSRLASCTSAAMGASSILAPTGLVERGALHLGIGKAGWDMAGSRQPRRG